MKRMLCWRSWRNGNKKQGGCAMKKIKVGICGAGAFSSHFTELFHSHPGVDAVYVADLIPDRCDAFMQDHACEKAFGSLDELCESDVDAIGIFTQRNLHAPQAVQALKAGKDVYCAVPAACSLEELEQLVRTVEETGQIYMTGETSCYYPSVLYCRQRFRQGDFGKFVYGEAQYTHDMETWRRHFEKTEGDQWKKYAGIPPMLYPTHSISMILSITQAFVTKVSCAGYRDSMGDGVYGDGRNLWNNPFSNEYALMQTSDGGSMRVTEARRVGLFNEGKEVCLNMFYGTDACYEEHSLSACMAYREDHRLEDVSTQVSCPYFSHNTAHYAEKSTEDKNGIDGFLGVGPMHPVERLPEEFKGLKNGHNGSHQFLVDDFIRACRQRALPPTHVWASARFCAPGLVAHESALQGGALLDVPDFGSPPEGSRFVWPNE